jgi:hypothetical protein
LGPIKWGDIFWGKQGGRRRTSINCFGRPFNHIREYAFGEKMSSKWLWCGYSGIKLIDLANKKGMGKMPASPFQVDQSFSSPGLD